MLQFNLLPDVKIKYIKARRQKRLTMLVAVLVGGASLGLLAIMMGFVYVVQGTQISNLDKEITRYNKELAKKSEEVDINKVLTIQNQLGSLDDLHSTKPITSRIYDYLAKLTPSNVTISSVTIATDGTGSMAMQGSTDTLESINRFVDTLKFTTYKTDPEAEPIIVFPSVVLNSFGRDLAGASYTLELTFEPTIFDSSTQGVAGMSVPTQVTTRSELDRPVFQTESERANNAPEPVGGN
jgi:uncharacterized membrane protein YciS (DUF1049 family)